MEGREEESLDWADLCGPGLSLRGQVGYGGGDNGKTSREFSNEIQIGCRHVVFLLPFPLPNPHTAWG